MNEPARWEYKTKDVDADDTSENFTAFLNTYASYGWELVSRTFVPETDDALAYYKFCV